MTSVYYGIDEADLNIAKIVKVHPEDIARINLDTKEELRIELN
jgi:hypothetical protein